MTSPTAVATTKHFTAITTGQNHACATESGTTDTYCWGERELGWAWLLVQAPRVAVPGPARIAANQLYTPP